MSHVQVDAAVAETQLFDIGACANGGGALKSVIMHQLWELLKEICNAIGNYWSKRLRSRVLSLENGRLHFLVILSWFDPQSGGQLWSLRFILVLLRSPYSLCQRLSIDGIWIYDCILTNQQNRVKNHDNCWRSLRLTQMSSNGNRISTEETYIFPPYQHNHSFEIRYWLVQ
jgi:hypothetical protein